MTTAKQSHFQVALRIRHPHVDPDQITREFAWHPTHSYKVGEPRTTPKGNPLAGRNDESYWYAELPAGDDDSMSAIISAANRRLMKSKLYIEQLINDGGVIEYFVGWFIDTNVGETFEWPLLQECAGLRIQLAFDIYPPDKTPKT